jgi:uncharacterized membrane protein
MWGTGSRPPRQDSLTPVLDRNIRELRARRERMQAEASIQDRLAQAITRFSGSMTFVYFHALAVAAWVAINAGLVPGLEPFDPSFVILATVASVEAIFLSTFVLISQNRAAMAADERADLDLQINLLAEHELTQLISLTRAIAERLDIAEAGDDSLKDAEKDIDPETVLDHLASGPEHEGTPPPSDGDDGQTRGPRP